MRKNPALTLPFFLLLLVAGCASPGIHSSDPDANYRHVFSTVSAPPPAILHSHLERFDRSFPFRGEYNGNWEFEMLVSPEWLAQVKSGFNQVPFHSVPPRALPDWFIPSPETFTAWRMQETSFPAAHLFIEKSPRSPDQIRVFIRRH